MTTPEDITKWLSYLLDSFKGNATAQIVSKESHGIIFKLHNRAGNYSLGVFQYPYKNGSFYEHQGHLNGISYDFCFSAVHDMGYFVATNTDDEEIYKETDCAAILDLIAHGNTTGFIAATNEKLRLRDEKVSNQTKSLRAVADYGKSATFSTTLPIQSYLGMVNTTEDIIHGYNITLVSPLPMILNFEQIFPFKVQPTMPFYKNYQLLHQGGDEFAILIGNHSFPTEGSVTFLITSNRVVGLNVTTPLPLARF